MIRPLRQRHRQIFFGLGIFLPLTFALGILARKPVPLNPPLPPTLASSALQFPLVKWERGDLFSKTAIRVRLRQTKTADNFAVEFSAPKNFTQPDVITYWVAGKIGKLEELPASAILLGSFNATLPLPTTASQSEGTLILYSLADAEIVDVSKPINPQTP